GILEIAGSSIAYNNLFINSSGDDIHFVNVHSTAVRGNVAITTKDATVNPGRLFEYSQYFRISEVFTAQGNLVVNAAQNIPNSIDYGRQGAATFVDNAFYGNLSAPGVPEGIKTYDNTGGVTQPKDPTTGTILRNPFLRTLLMVDNF